jgi:uncharacterized protein (TIGR00661 family)
VRILVGVCGIGLGHAIRQSILIEALRRRGARVVALLGRQAVRYFRDEGLADLPHREVAVPWIAADRDGIDWTVTRSRNEAELGSLARSAHSAYVWVEEVLGGQPDLCISDYDPLTAAYAYEHAIPLVTFDQQSKYLGYATRDIGRASRQEERARLAYFFPYAEARLAVSFFRVDESPDPEFEVDLFPAPVRRRVASCCCFPGDRHRVVVYLSPYGPTAQTPAQLIAVLSQFSSYTFTLYDGLSRIAPGMAVPNVEVKPVHGGTFVDDLAKAGAAIATAGHTLITECLYLGRPVHAIPLGTYDQGFCASVVEALGVGTQARCLEPERLADFLRRIPQLAESIADNAKVTVSNAISAEALERVWCCAQASSRTPRPVPRGRPTIPDRLFLPDPARFKGPTADPETVEYKTAVIKPTLACPCRCGICRARAKRWWKPDAKEMTIPEWSTILDQMAEMGFTTVVLSGGEPLVYPHVIALTRAIRKRGMAAVLNTNGIRFDAPMRDALLEAGLNGVNFSLDSPSPAVHDRLRGRDGVWRDCVRGIRLATETATLWTAIRMVLLDVNLAELPATLALAARLGVTSLKLSYLESGRPDSSDAPSLESMRRLREYITPACQALLPEIGLEIHRCREARRILEELLFPAEIAKDVDYTRGVYWKDRAMTRHCRLPQSLTIIHGDGAVLPCNAAEYMRVAAPSRVGPGGEALRDVLLGSWMDRFRTERLDYCVRCPMPLHLTVPLREGIT